MEAGLTESADSAGYFWRLPMREDDRNPEFVPSPLALRLGGSGGVTLSSVIGAGTTKPGRLGNVARRGKLR